MTRSNYLITGAVLLALNAFETRAQQSGSAPDPITPAPAPVANTNVAQPQRTEAKRLFWVIPNYKTADMPNPYTPLTVKEKFKLASQDSFDRGTVVLAALFAGLGQLNNSEKSFGQGVEGYSKYFAASYANWAIGDFMTEAIFPSMLHQDPRYFRLGSGGWKKRLGYAMGQIFWTHSDYEGKGQFNFSEIGGNSAAVAISNIYYKDNRTASNAISGLGSQLGVDMASNILKEFWPEIDRKLSRKHKPADVH